MQYQHQRCVGAVRAVPVEIEKIAIFKPQAFAFAADVHGFTPQRPPQGLQVRIAEAEGGGEAFWRMGHVLSRCSGA
ncbi:hypothetical protein D9M73_156420 [compost metagenome]